MKTVIKFRLDRVLFFLLLVFFVVVLATPLQAQVIQNHRTKKKNKIVNINLISLKF